jgi:hypothetical protein
MKKRRFNLVLFFITLIKAYFFYNKKIIAERKFFLNNINWNMIIFFLN